MNDQKLAREAEAALTSAFSMEPIVKDTPKRAATSVEGVPVAKGYEELYRILQAAFKQTAVGKGHQRHAPAFGPERPWEQQQSMQIGRAVGPGFAAGQVSKKAQEAVTLSMTGDIAKAKEEALGVISYGAQLFKLLDEME